MGKAILPIDPEHEEQKDSCNVIFQMQPPPTPIHLFQ